MGRKLRNEIIKGYIEKSQDKDFQINQIRAELEARGIPELEIRAVVR
ncbi:MAG: hypothetical protein ACJAWV_001885 [Flammeovirgaceae bacterium]|jgi:hypothetical protein